MRASSTAGRWEQEVEMSAPFAEPPYPARLDARLEEPLSPWLWLVKIVLLIPHFVILTVLWIGVVLCTIAAGFAIVFTGRYPRKLFDFNLGVMRWSWRVSYYSISGFGTDRYPPFTLDRVPDYPAQFDVDYPEELSRGLVLVKWWLLAIPHYLIVAFFTGGWSAAWPPARMFLGGGLIAVLSVVAIVITAIRKEYPPQLYDLILGMDRWCFRVMAYAGLMRDEYPPFRLDQGGTDPGTAAAARSAAPPAPPPPPPPPPAAPAGAEPAAPTPSPTDEEELPGTDALGDQT
jgi:hypothetical protein